MGDEAFDSFNAPQFVDFSRRHDYSDESADAFFDFNHENGHATENVSVRKRKLSSDEYFSPLAELDCSTERNDAGDHVEHSYEEPKELKIRRSMSVGNLIMFSEEEHHQEYQSCLKQICENVQSLNVSSEEEKPKEEIKCDIKESNLCRNSNQSLYRKHSQEHLNKLAQPKRYASVENLKQGNISRYVSLAEAVNQFQNRTPVRFRSKPNLYHQPSQPLTRTVPESPALHTKARSRPGHHVLSHEEKEQMEFENMQKFKIKANPVNKKILQGPLKPVVPVDRKAPTKPQPFNLTKAPPKKAMPCPKKYEFHAKPVPRSAEKPRQSHEIQRRMVTKPITPTFMKNYKPPLHRVEQNDQNSKELKHDEKPRTLTKPKPFSFEERDRMVQRKREKLIQARLEEERRAREFHAKPIPKSIYKKGDSIKSDSGSSVGSSRKHTHSSENISTQFKARPPVVLYKEPFVPAKAEKPPTQVIPFHLESELRRYEREEFERERLLKEERLEYLKKQEEEIRLRQEQEEIARIRKEAEYKAKPIKKYKEVTIQPSRKVTIPISPKFHSNMLRQSKNKENIPDNSNQSH